MMDRVTYIVREMIEECQDLSEEEFVRFAAETLLLTDLTQEGCAGCIGRVLEYIHDIVYGPAAGVV